MLLPANTTRYMQPLNQGIIYCDKGAYCKQLVRFLLHEIKRNVSVGKIRKWNVLDALRSVAVTWDSISAEVIRNSFAKCGFGQEKVASDEDARVDEENGKWVELRQLIELPASFQEYLTADESVPVTDENLDMSVGNN
ncbi:hypothetical protein PR048_006903 [Dryococelus australis]|uniref:DDE-1 domain-containing protein n=1 Tax=Dryococelus australis TaxID=614101 RepID=A0ABQ9IC90_9NEOP|nr:hypothetical protein PR048_006903 [Dryococelus australis]